MGKPRTKLWITETTVIDLAGEPGMVHGRLAFWGVWQVSGHISEVGDVGGRRIREQASPISQK